MKCYNHLVNLETNKILVYTFFVWSKTSFKFLRNAELPGCNKMYIKNIQEAHRLAKHIFYRKYDIVLGIADNNKNATKHKIETSFCNLYGKKEIIKDGPGLFTPTLVIPPSDDLYYANHTTTGPCNRSAYLIAKTIAGNEMKTKFGFVHINKNLSIAELNETINGWLLNN